jgi:T-complex protein 1 subunit delta
LAENAGLSPINIVTELRNKHARGEKNAGISLKRFGISENIGKYLNIVLIIKELKMSYSQL